MGTTVNGSHPAIVALREEITAREQHLEQLRASAEDLAHLLAGHALAAPARAEVVLALPAPEETPGEETPAPVVALSPAPAAPHVPRSPSAYQAAVKARRDKVLSAVLTHGPCTRAAVTEVVGLPDTTVRTVLQDLVKDGVVVATGATRTRRYQAAPHKPHTPARAKLDAGIKRKAADMDSGIARVKLRDQIIAAVKADNGLLTCERLAWALDTDRELLQEQVEWLAVRDQLSVEHGGLIWRGRRCPR